MLVDKHFGRNSTITCTTSKHSGIRWNFALESFYFSTVHGSCYSNQVCFCMNWKLFGRTRNYLFFFSFPNSRWCHTSVHDGHPCVFQYLVRGPCGLGGFHEAPHSCSQNLFVARGESSAVATIRWCLRYLLSGKSIFIDRTHFPKDLFNLLWSLFKYKMKIFHNFLVIDFNSESYIPVPFEKSITRRQDNTLIFLLSEKDKAKD